jgi:hypothetical protein
MGRVRRFWHPASSDTINSMSWVRKCLVGKIGIQTDQGEAKHILRIIYTRLIRLPGFGCVANVSGSDRVMG